MTKGEKTARAIAIYQHWKTNPDKSLRAIAKHFGVDLVLVSNTITERVKLDFAKAKQDEKKRAVMDRKQKIKEELDGYIPEDLFNVEREIEGIPLMNYKAVLMLGDKS